MKKNKIAFILNVLIVLMVSFASLMMFTGIKITHGVEPVLESTGLSIFRFFTVDSNLFQSIMSLIFACYEYKLIKGKISYISKKLYILKFMSTVAVCLTFLVVLFYLGPIAKGGLLSLLRNSNLFLHLLVPVTSIICFVFFESSNKLKAKDTFYGLVPVMIYAVYYLSNVLIHMEDGKVSPKYDFYWFVQSGVKTVFIVIPVMLIFTYLISFVIWKYHSKFD